MFSSLYIRGFLFRIGGAMIYSLLVIIGFCIGYAYAVFSIHRRFRHIPRQEKKKERMDFIQFLPDDIDTEETINYESRQRRDI